MFGKEPAWNKARIYLHRCYIHKTYLEVPRTSSNKRECCTITNGILQLEYKRNICTLNYYLSVAEIPTTPLNVTVDAERTSRGGNTVIRLDWMRPQNFHRFDIDRYQINVTSTSGIQNMTMACGECTSTVITVSENPNNVRLNTTFTITISARNRCGETGPTATASYTLSKLPLLIY